MPKTISDELKAHLAGGVTTLATCWKITRTDSQAFGFTDHQSNIVVGGVTYKATTGMRATAVESSVGLSVDNLDVEGLLSGSDVTESDLLLGKYDYATVEIFLVNYADLSQGTLVLRKGTLGEVKLRRGIFLAELRGLTQRLIQNFIEAFSQDCRAKLGDSRCRINLAPFTFGGSVSSAVSRRDFNSNLTQADGYFSYGKLTWTSGGNAGLSAEILFSQSSGGRVLLWLPMPFDISAGNAFTVAAGCDKNFSTCKTKFNNAVNFRGEPHVPSGDDALEYPGDKSRIERS